MSTTTCLPAAGLLLLAGLARAAPSISWTFDTPLPAASTRGRTTYVTGVTGKALQFDGFTTTVVEHPPAAFSLDRGLALEAWIAPQEYSWNWTPIANQGVDRQSGFFFGIDHAGRLGLSLAIEGAWKTVASAGRLPLLRWSHVAASFDPSRGIALYIDGKQVAAEPIRGRAASARDDIWLGASQMPMDVTHTEREASRKAVANTRMVFDGLLDEVAIYSRPLTPAEVAAAFSAARPAVAQPLQYRALPSGPRSAGRFGAFYEPLRYADGWDALWRGAGPDVVVAFDFAPVRLVAWRGISYNPCWVTEKGYWFSNEFMERSVPAGCAESMSDKQARYSSIKILESNDARVVLYWRYSPVDIHYQIPFPDPVTGWGDWGEEFYTIYPDGVAVRKFTGYTSVPRGKSFWEWSQSLPILHPGQKPEDILHDQPLVSFAAMDGRARDYPWPPRPEDAGLPNANIQVVNYRSDYKPFLILTDRKPRLWLPRYVKPDPKRPAQGLTMSSESKFWWWNHWPVAMLPNDGRVAQAADRPSHSWAANQDSAPWETTPGTETQIMLCGRPD